MTDSDGPGFGAVISDNELAWLLADTAGNVLRGDQRAALFVELGAGEPLLAIERVLSTAAAQRHPLDSGLLDVMNEWLDRYVGFSHERRLRRLLQQLRSCSATRTLSQPAKLNRVRNLKVASTARAPGRKELVHRLTG